ncbi:mlh1 [[Candida] subhashii]|uniref:Mlh1 n=1 Tax=[Candida] subhashii TaxID=561895 RepID=A0A8J5R437_9ASCO|nr:mlh1 [[Candida] subhashii]KAG7665155.1 mlh1 [[Candida] subhashii]
MSDTTDDSTRRIQKLDTSVVNKIAAGEIIIQPANALKEMLENSIDAKATMIDILVKDGGLKLLKITDNGNGIHKDDLPLLCERFATSKLRKFEDLESIATYGFRGEALASISHISRLSVITKTQDSKLAYKAFYINGKLCGSNFKPSSSNVEPKPTAGRDGTQIIVEDLFYNIPSRLRGLKSKSEEYAKVLDIVGRYSIHTGHVGFSCKKFGDPIQQLNTRPDLPLKERIRIVYGSEVANELMFIESDNTSEELGLGKVVAAITNANFNNRKKIQPIFFINHRLVSCEPLKRAINSVFQFFLPKGSHPFFYISLEIKSENLDVNVHPTKREVRFLHEDEIIELLVDKVHATLSSVDTSRKFKTQTIVSKRPQEEMEDVTSSTQIKKYRQENKLMRVDASQAKLSSFLASQPSQSYQESIKREFTFREDSIIEGEDPDDSSLIQPTQNTTIETNDRPRVQVNLESITSLKQELTEFIDKPLTNIFNHAVYVGIIDPIKRICCFQYDVKLFMCDYAAMLLELYYQIGLHEFCNFGEIQLDEPIPLSTLLAPLYNEERKSDLKPMEEIIENIVRMKDMFWEYFQIGIADSCLTTLPMILPGIEPDFNKLPYFLYRLGTRINYENEKECLKGILRQIALLYLPEPSDDESKRCALELQLENILFPEIKKQLLAPRNLLRDVVQIADLPGLYKVFERC